MSRFVLRSQIAAPARDVFAWHARPGALQRLNPPWEPAELVRLDGIRDGDIAELRVGLGPVKQRWVARHRDYIEGRQFADEQIEGPFARWLHVHRFEQKNGSACLYEDDVTYELPLAGLGRAVGGDFIRRKLERMFAYRHAVVASDLERHQSAPRSPLTIAISGATGLIGSALSAFLTTGGHRVLPLVRRPARRPDEIAWDPTRGEIERDKLEGLDAVIHLAGAGIADERWTAARKREIHDSRVAGTRLISATLASLRRPPSVLVSASAIGWYGERSGVVDESAARGEGFLADICADWETAADAARAAGIRVVHPRIGIVLTPAGGALAKMLTPFKLGLGARLGDGSAPVSWVAIDDVLGALHFALYHRALEGPFNVTAPAPTTQGKLATALGQALHRPSALRVPAAALRLLLGELAESVLAGATVLPARLLTAGFHFHHPTLAGALGYLLGVHSAGEAAELPSVVPVDHGRRVRQ